MRSDRGRCRASRSATPTTTSAPRSTSSRRSTTSSRSSTPSAPRPSWPAGRGFAQRLEGVLLAWLDVAEPHHEFAGQFFKNAADPASPLSPFSAGVRSGAGGEHRALRTLVEGSDVKVAPALRRELPELLWLLQMGVVLFWVYDASAGQKRSRMLVQPVVPIVDRLVRLSRLPVVRGRRRRRRSGCCTRSGHDRAHHSAPQAIHPRNLCGDPPRGPVERRADRRERPDSLSTAPRRPRRRQRSDNGLGHRLGDAVEGNCSGCWSSSPSLWTATRLVALASCAAGRVVAQGRRVVRQRGWSALLSSCSRCSRSAR